MALKLNPGERSILATFQQFPRAEAARSALNRAGFATAKVDRIGEAGYNPNPGYFSPYHGQATSLAGITYFDSPAELGDQEKRPLLAAKPEASGMAGDLTARGQGVLLTAVVPEDRLQTALEIIRQLGGEC